MFVSTKLGTIVKLSASERLTAPQPPDRSLARFGVAALALYQGGELSPQERRNRETPLRGKYTCLTERLLIEGERDVSRRGHGKNV
jgi:hypothetical protein